MATATVPATWTIYPSLLSTLEGQSLRDTLEKAVCAHHCSRFEDAAIIFHAQLPKSTRVPILALEQSDMLTTQGKEHERIALLKKAIENEEIWSASLEDEFTRLLVKQLMQLLLADAEYWAFGKLKPLLDEARRMRQLLQGIKEPKLTDIEVDDGPSSSKCSC